MKIRRSELLERAARLNALRLRACQIKSAALADLGLGSCSLTTTSKIVHDSNVYAFNVRMKLVTDTPRPAL